MNPLQANSVNSSAMLSTASTRRLRPCVVGLFFVWGFATVLVDTLIPRLKALFTLSYAEVMLTQFSFFLAYFFVSIPAGWLIARVGYVRGIVFGLAMMALGCLLFVPASSSAIFGLFLPALCYLWITTYGFLCRSERLAQ